MACAKWLVVFSASQTLNFLQKPRFQVARTIAEAELTLFAMLAAFRTASWRYIFPPAL